MSCQNRGSYRGRRKRNTRLLKTHIASRQHKTRAIECYVGGEHVCALLYGVWMSGVPCISIRIFTSIPPVFEAKRGGKKCSQKTPTGGASTCANLPQMQIERTGKVLAAHADHAHLLLFYVYGHVDWGAKATRAQEAS